MERGQPLEPASSELGQGQPHDPLVVSIRRTVHEPRLLGTIDETDGAVVPKLKMLGHVADRGLPVASVAPDGEQQLVLRRRQTGGRGLVLTPAQKPP
jgi:hypothetical protein